MTDRLIVEVADHIATVRLNRPGKHNAVDAAMFDAFIDTGSSLAADRSIRAVVLTGAGDNFCAGIDVSTFAGDSIDGSKMAPVTDSIANYYQSAAYVWRQMPVPVIAALRGYVFGAGFQIALGADLRDEPRDNYWPAFAGRGARGQDVAQDQLCRKRRAASSARGRTANAGDGGTEPA
jgi:enoyl-CoA hydratase/carnithine racemase